ncbi:Eco57I restriction-modification methylase domain-containing protein [Halorubrum halophilum]|uniref:Eco57I restriction-modification methylase domain-containing protein n=1 Tax=Halorubrum halophilum TaxID=413816 RepID=UPI000679B2B2|nr:type IIL restriction-modification enzyme MmeI [Halorubrum halophilum]
MSASDAQTEFDFDEFDTTVSDDDVDIVINAIDSCIRSLRDQYTDDDDLDKTFSRGRGEYVPRSDYTRDQLDPEPLTQDRVIEPLLDVLGYSDYGAEAGDFSSTRGEQADYAVSLRDIDSVDSSRLLIEAEPLKKQLENRGHGVDQVKSWLSQREFESDFGFATDGLRWIFIRYDADSYTHTTVADVDLQPVFLTLFENQTGASMAPTDAVSEEERELIAELIRTFNFDNFRSIIDDAQEVLKEKQEEITDEFYDDYIRYVFGVDDSDVDGERRARSLVGDGVIAPGEATGDDTRLFSVELMNRLVFIKFLEDKRIVRPDLLRTIVDTYEDGVYTQSMYETFLDPLFYDVMNVKPDREDGERTDVIDLYSDIPYLNGGLFRPELSTDSDVDERQFDVRDSVLKSIINLLERYQFSADGGPTDIDPSVLGSVFEKTINYLTTDPGDQNKELGAYYTPSEITRFSAEETVQPALHERFQEYLIEERGWREVEARQSDTVYELINDLAPKDSLIRGLLEDVVDEFYVVDPACGSGHYLTSVLEEIVSIRTALYAQIDSHPRRFRLKKATVQNNIYGVDIVGPAVEIGKLRCWLSIVAELSNDDIENLNPTELALPNIAFNLRTGNSLIGFTSFPESTDDGGYTLEAFNEDSVRSRYQDVIEQINKYERAGEQGLSERADEHYQKANELLEEYRPELDSLIYDEFLSLDVSVDSDTLRNDYGEKISAEVFEAIEGDLATEITKEDIDAFDTFHWILEFAEVYAHGGFDVVVGNPPWEVLTSNREEYFSKFDALFRTRSLDEKDRIESDLLDNPETAKGWIEHQRRMDILSTYFKQSKSYSLQSPDVGGQAKGDLSMLFLERVFSLTDEDGYVSKLLPGKLFTGTANKDLRNHLLSNTEIGYIVGFENKGMFEEIDDRYKFGAVTYKNSGSTQQLRVKFLNRDPRILQDVEEHTFNVPVEVLRDYSPQTAIFPQITNEKEVPLLRKIVQNPPINKPLEDNWYIDLYKEELNRTRDSDRFVENEVEGDYPVYGGGNIWQYAYDNTFWDDIAPPTFWSVEEDVNPDKSAKRRVREKNAKRLKTAIFNAFDGSGSQIGFVRDLLEKHRGTEFSESDVLLDCTTHRIGIREISNNTNERSSVAAVLPRGVVCHHKCPTIRPYEINPTEDDLKKEPAHGVYERIFTDKELFAALGILNSVPFDYIVRTKLDTSLSMNMFEECQAPRLTKGDDWFEDVWKRSAKLNCYGDEFDDIASRLGILPVESDSQREILQAEIDAAMFHAYEFDRTETKFMLEDFHKVRSPRVMTDEYFDLVLEKFDELAAG